MSKVNKNIWVHEKDRMTTCIQLCEITRKWLLKLRENLNDSSPFISLLSIECNSSFNLLYFGKY